MTHTPMGSFSSNYKSSYMAPQLHVGPYQRWPSVWNCWKEWHTFSTMSLLCSNVRWPPHCLDRPCSPESNANTRRSRSICSKPKSLEPSKLPRTCILFKQDVQPRVSGNRKKQYIKHKLQVAAKETRPSPPIPGTGIQHPLDQNVRDEPADVVSNPGKNNSFDSQTTGWDFCDETIGYGTDRGVKHGDDGQEKTRHRPQSCCCLSKNTDRPGND